MAKKDKVSSDVITQEDEDEVSSNATSQEDEEAFMMDLSNEYSAREVLDTVAQYIYDSVTEFRALALSEQFKQAGSPSVQQHFQMMADSFERLAEDILAMPTERSDEESDSGEGGDAT